MAGWEESITVVIYDYPWKNGETVLVKETGKVPRTDIALPLWIAMSKPCLRWLNACSSPSWMANRPPRSLRNSVVPGPHTPMVSIATGMKWCDGEWCDGDNAEYFAILLVSATDAAAPATREVWTRCDGARVSGQVKSHTSYQPQDHGMRVAPSGRIPWLRKSPRGSNMGWMPALRSKRAMRSFTIWWRVWRTALLLQARQWWLLGCTLAPQTHVCELTIGQPRRTSTAILVFESERRNPKFAEGQAWSQKPTPGAQQARSLARSEGKELLKKFYGLVNEQCEHIWNSIVGNNKV